MCISTPLLLLFLVALAAAIPHLDLMISLVGCFCGAALCIIVPATLDIIMLWPDQYGCCKWRLVKDVLICVLGVVGFVLGTAVTVKAIVETYQ